MTRARELADLLTGGQTISTADNTEQLIFKSTDADASVGPVLRMNRDSGSPADNDVTGGILFNADDGAGNSTEIVSILTQIQTVANGSEDGRFQMSAMKAGTARNRFDITNTETVFNEDSVDVDFRVESNGDANSFVVEGATKGIGMGTNDPTIDSSLAGISVASGSRVLHIHDADGAYLKVSDPASGSNRGAQFGMIGTTTIVNNCESGDMIFGTGNTERMKILSGGNVDLSASHLVLDNGYGINFAATSDASGMTGEILDDYEEGTWTPVLSTSSGTAATYGAQQIGKYVKIGDLVHIYFDIGINQVNNSNTTLVSGHPFNSVNNDALTVSFFSTLAVSPVFVSFQCAGSQGFMAVGLTTAGTNITNGMGVFGNSTRIIASGTYRTS